MKINGSIILVTGGASGIGESIAKYLYSLGGVVYISDIQEMRGKEIEREYNKKIKFMKCDITNEDEVIKMVEIIKEKENRIDILINCAGIAIAERLATKKTMHSNESFNNLWNVNVNGTFLVSKHVAKVMINNYNVKNECNGVIILLSSINAFEGAGNLSAYSSTKSALVAMVTPMSRDLGKYKIRVNSIAPTLTQTPMMDEIRETKIIKIIIESTPLKSLCRTEDINLACEFIIQCDFINATTFRIDGGFRTMF